MYLSISLWQIVECFKLLFSQHSKETEQHCTNSVANEYNNGKNVMNQLQQYQNRVKLCDLNDKRPLLRSKSFFWSNSVVPQYSWLSFKEIFSLWQFNSPSLPRFSSNLFFTFMNSLVNAFSKTRYVLFFTKQSSFHSSFPIFAKDTSTSFIHRFLLYSKK